MKRSKQKLFPVTGGILLSLIVSACSGGDQKGTLTYLDDKLVFESDSERLVYDPAKAPGIKVLAFQKKFQMKEGKETDVSELTISFASSMTATLIPAQPIHVIKISNGPDIQWKLDER